MTTKTRSTATQTVPGYITIIIGDEFDIYPCGSPRGSCVVASICVSPSYSLLLIL